MCNVNVQRFAFGPAVRRGDPVDCRPPDSLLSRLKPDFDSLVSVDHQQFLFVTLKSVRVSGPCGV